MMALAVASGTQVCIWILPQWLRSEGGAGVREITPEACHIVFQALCTKSIVDGDSMGWGLIDELSVVAGAPESEASRVLL